MNDNGGCLYAFGRGSFYALLIVILPGILVFLYYDDIKARVDGISGLPVFHEMKNEFKTGADIIGATFARELQQFYADTIEQRTLISAPGKKGVYWHRAAIEQELKQKLSRGSQPNAIAYLNYLEQHRDMAVLEMQRTKIPASITLAQGLLETNAGRSILATKGNNHFGIKCRSRTGFRRDGVIDDNDFNFHSLAIDCMQMKDDYVWDRFEVYRTAGDSYRRHSLLLQDRRYGWMLHRYEVGGIYRISKSIYGHYEVPYYAAWSVGLKQSGYATARTYAEILTLIIETYQLWRIDYEAVVSE
ncbi:MAG: glucosaminidase domain-containing protein [Lewinellaceae bacterium]|nr:glucosaminidase domain-containing protein [Lewinellaceae bacterium]